MNHQRVMRRRGSVLAAVALVALGIGGGLSSGAWAAARRGQVLSNETTFTRWAYVAHVAAIYRTPTLAAPRVGRLHWDTEDGYPEIYLVLRAHWAKGQEWIKLRIPARPNGQVGWVQRNTLGRFHLTHQQVVVNRARLRLYFYDSGHLVWSAPVAVGKPSTPTPPGHFWVREKFPLLPRSSLYYPYAFGTADYSSLTEWPRGGVVGIHGPYGALPSQIPGRISHGCIRLHVADDFWLGHHLTIGTPVRVI